MKKRIDLTALENKLTCLKQLAWNSNREGTEYEKGYNWGVYWAVSEVEKIVGPIKIDCEHLQSTGRNGPAIESFHNQNESRSGK